MVQKIELKVWENPFPHDKAGIVAMLWQACPEEMAAMEQAADVLRESGRLQKRSQELRGEAQAAREDRQRKTELFRENLKLRPYPGRAA